MIYIRTDMNDTIATGHMMRCLAIANAARSMGENTTFILSDNEAIPLLQEYGYKYIVLHTSWDDMDSEIKILKNVICKLKIKRILIDSYQVTKEYFGMLQRYTDVYYIDDLDTDVYCVKGLVCYEVNWDSRGYEQKYPNTELMIGLKYTPLRSEFYELSEKKINTTIKNILLLSGGTDSHDFLESVLENLDKKKYDSIDVIYGRYYKKCDYLRKKYLDYSNIMIWQNVDNIEKFMMKADLAISAGGTTLYELCACGTPTISYSLADNQLNSVLSFQEKGLIEYAGDIRTDNVLLKINDLLEKYSSREMRQIKSKKMRKIIDGKGALRIAKQLIVGNVFP